MWDSSVPHNFEPPVRHRGKGGGVITSICWPLHHPPFPHCGTLVAHGQCPDSQQGYTFVYNLLFYLYRKTPSIWTGVTKCLQAKKYTKDNL